MALEVLISATQIKRISIHVMAPFFISLSVPFFSETLRIRLKNNETLTLLYLSY